MFTYMATLVAALASLILICAQAQATPENNAHQQHINIDITSHLGDKQTYTEGDIISFYLSLDRDAFILVIYQDAAGNLTQIIPNKLSSNNFFQAGDFFTVPNADSPFKFVVSKPFGTEYLWAFANDKSFPTLKGITLKNGFILLKDKLNNIKETLHTFGKESDGYFGQASTTIITLSAPP